MAKGPSARERALLGLAALCCALIIARALFKATRRLRLLRAADSAERFPQCRLLRHNDPSLASTADDGLHFCERMRVFSFVSEHARQFIDLDCVRAAQEAELQAQSMHSSL